MKKHYICNEFLANHNKDYSVVKTFGEGSRKVSLPSFSHHF